MGGGEAADGQDSYQSGAFVRLADSLGVDSRSGWIDGLQGMCQCTES